MGADDIEQLEGVLDGLDRVEHLAADFFVVVGVVVEKFAQLPLVGLDGSAVLDDVDPLLDLRLQETVMGDRGDDARPRLALDEGLDGAVGEAQQLHHRRQRPELIEIVDLRVVDGGLLLGDEEDIGLLLHGVLERQNRFPPADHQRGHHMGEYH